MAPLPKDRKSSQKGPSIFDQFGMPKSSLDITNPRPPSALELGTSSSKGQRTELQENQQLPTANQILARRQTGILKRFYYQENILALQQSCSIVGPLIRAARARASRVSRSDPVNTVEDFRIRRVGDKTEFWAPILILSGVQQNGTKTLGFIRVKQSPFPFMASASGWTSTNKSSEDLLDSEVCTIWNPYFISFPRFSLRE
jgi:hypothetical protein